MVKAKRKLILSTFFLSGTACILAFVSLGTQSWIVSQGKWTNQMLDRMSTIKYGLFSGIFVQKTPIQRVFEIKMTCWVSKNVCALLCGNDADERMQQLKDLYHDREVKFNTDCPAIPSSAWERTLMFPLLSAASADKQYINAAVWISTIVFISVSALMGLVSAGLAVWNTATNPVEVYLSIYGLFVYNAIALVSSLLVLLLWGIMFASTTVHNVAILYTLIGDIDTDGRAHLGYSYWINALSLVCYISSISLLYFRQYLVSRERNVNVHIEDNADPGLYLY